ncbi:hypothetical protein [Paenibacillus barengoltzii]|nr:hypothetical protein [Paenibacillus barengoltzii]
MKFIGIDDVQVIYVEGTSEKPDQAAEIKEKAIEQAIQMAKGF